MLRTESQIRQTIIGMGIDRGLSVSWKPSFANRRYGCVMSLEGCKDGKVLVLASNGHHRISAVLLRLEPDCDDPITADQTGIYSDLDRTPAGLTTADKLPPITGRIVLGGPIHNGPES